MRPTHQAVSESQICWRFSSATKHNINRVHGYLTLKIVYPGIATARRQKIKISLCTELTTPEVMWLPVSKTIMLHTLFYKQANRARGTWAWGLCWVEVWVDFKVNFKVISANTRVFGWVGLGSRVPAHSFSHSPVYVQKQNVNSAHKAILFC